MPATRTVPSAHVSFTAMPVPPAASVARIQHECFVRMCIPPPLPSYAAMPWVSTPGSTQRAMGERRMLPDLNTKVAKARGADGASLTCRSQEEFGPPSSKGALTLAHVLHPQGVDYFMRARLILFLICCSPIVPAAAQSPLF